MTVPLPASRPPVVLLCGGLGLRQRAPGDDTPKPLRPLPDGRALLLHVLDYYRAFGLDEFVLCVGYGARSLERVLLEAHGVHPKAVETGVDGARRFATARSRVTLVDSGPLAEKTQRLWDARPYIGDRPFVLGYADVLSDLDLDRLLSLHEAADPVLTMATTRVRSRYGEVRLGADRLVTSFSEKPERPELISAGYFVCGAALFGHLAEGSAALEEEVIPRLVARREVRAVVHEGLWLPFDTYKDFAEAEALIEREGCSWLTPV
jgi:glucose-1-phosphate cytidylyltransferase